MTKQTRIHDGVVAAINLLSVVLAVWVSIQWLWVAAGVGAIMVSSVFTGFCPVHYTVNKLLPPDPRA